MTHHHPTNDIIYLAPGTDYRATRHAVRYMARLNAQPAWVSPLVAAPAPAPQPKPTVTEKLCKVCQSVKPRDGFSLCRSTPDGLQGMCKVCQKVYARENYLRTRDHHLRMCAERRKRYGRSGKTAAA